MSAAELRTMTEEFFHTIFGSLDGHVAYIWTMPDKISTYFKDLDEMSAFAERQSEKNNEVYYGTCPTKEAMGPRERPKAKEVSRVYFVHCDVDIYNREAHKKTNLPKTVEEAMQVIGTAVPFVPSLVVNSGNGLHVYWLLKSPIELSTIEARNKASHIINAFQDKIKEGFESFGLTMDKTADLSRVLRVPGTFNNKGGTRKEVRIEESNDNRYSARELWDFVTVAKGSVVERKEITQSVQIIDDRPFAISIDTNANPPAGKLDAMLETEPRFAAIWRGKAFKSTGDMSFSSLDMSLANFAANYDWSDQEIADLIIAFRRKFGRTEDDVKKAHRKSYLQNTIVKARKKRKEQAAKDEIVSSCLNVPATSRQEEKERQKKILEQLRDATGLKIKKILRIMAGKNATFEIVLDSGIAIPVKDAKTLNSEALLRSSISAVINHYLPRFGRNDWPDVAASMLYICEDIELAEDTRDSVYISEMIWMYIAKSAKAADKTEADMKEIPWEEDGKVFVIASAFKQWARAQGEMFDRTTLAMALRDAGIQTEKVNITKANGERSSRRCYIVKR